jgi:hypothetical protein
LVRLHAVGRYRETRHGEALAELIRTSPLYRSDDVEIDIVVPLLTPGQKRNEIDIAVFGRCKRPIVLDAPPAFTDDAGVRYEPSQVRIWTFCVLGG